MQTYRQRIEKLCERLRRADVEALVVAPGSDLRYLCGYDAPALERPSLLIVRGDGEVSFVAPELERLRVEQEVHLPDVQVITYGELDDPFRLAGRAVDPSGRSSIAIGDRMWTSFALGLQGVLPGRSWLRASEFLGPLRAVKDAEEIAALAAAGRAIDRVHTRVPDVLRPGKTEAQVARELANMIRDEHDAMLFVIVASGENSASPHHEPGQRIIEKGDVVVVDIGGSLDGYCSDMTRMYAIASSPPGFAAAYAALETAQSAGVQAVRPGATAGEVDAAARDVLADAGLGPAFVHRTGHGIGLDVHEEPWILPASEQVLREGMAFSVEPGFYLEGVFGARIEDIVTVTESSVTSFNHVDRSLVVIS